jgi:hypothetical protein
MPKLECRICNKMFKSTNMYYCHLYSHINHTTELTADEIYISTKYHERRRAVKKNSYEKRKIECPKIQCSLCEFKTHLKSSITKHLIAVHSKEELLSLGYSEEFIELHTEKHKKILEYLKNYNKKNITSENDNQNNSSDSESTDIEPDNNNDKSQIIISATLPINMFNYHQSTSTIARRPIPIPTIAKFPIPIPTIAKFPIPIPINNN